MNEPSVFSAAAASRGDSMAYPFYSVRSERTELLLEARAFLREQGIEFTEQVVPGNGCEEIGFLIAAEDLSRMFERRAAMPLGFRTDFMGWVVTPSLTKIPTGLAVPDECFHDPLVVLQATAESDWVSGRETKRFLNVATDEVATVDFDHDDDRYVVNCDVSHWRHACIV